MLGLGLSLAVVAVLATVVAAAAAPNPLLIAADNLRVPIKVWTDAARPSSIARIPHNFGEGALSEIRFGYCAWFINSGGGEEDVASWRLDAAALEIAGTTVPITFGGARTLTLATGETLRLSDPILPGAVGLSVFPASAAFYERIKARMLAGNQLPQNSALSQNYFYATANDANAVDATGGLNAPVGGAADANTVGACIIVGRYAASGRRAVIATGTSISTAFGDTGGDGFVARALHGDGTNTIAGTIMSAAGTTATQYGLYPAKRRSLMVYANVLHDEYATNDIANGTQTSGAGLFGAGRTIWRDARAAGVQRIVKTTIHARTTSSDGWTTRAGQTPIAGFGGGGIRDAANALYAASGEIDAVADLDALLDDPADRHVWTSAGGVAQTADGVHPYDHVSMATVARAAILAVAVDANAGAPVNLAAPAATSLFPQVGVAVTLDGDGVWREAYRAVFTHQWRRDGAAIAGATGADYVPVAADAGATLARVTTATSAAGATAVTTTLADPVAAAFGTRFFQTGFPGAYGTPLTATTAETGQGWAAAAGSSNSVVLRQPGIGASDAALNVVRLTGDSPGADVEVFARITRISASGYTGIYARASDAGEYALYFNQDSNALLLQKTVGGVGTTLASYAPPTAGDHVVRLRVTTVAGNAVLEAAIDGVALGSAVTDASPVAGPGRIGILTVGYATAVLDGGR